MSSIFISIIRALFDSRLFRRMILACRHPRKGLDNG
jgi:hypothetical protein